MATENILGDFNPSPDIVAEISDVFCTKSSTGDEKGYVLGAYLSRMYEGLGIEMTKPLIAYYSEEGKNEKFYYESFLKNIKTTMGKTPALFDEDITETFQYFSTNSNNNNKVLAVEEFHSLLTNLGEHIDHYDVEMQIKECLGDPDDIDEIDAIMNSDEFIKMTRATHGYVVEPEA
jgi:Ca2+-binding EF-hand superfamily protein